MVQLSTLILVCGLLLSACNWQTVPHRRNPGTVAELQALEQARQGLRAARDNRPELAVAAFDRALTGKLPSDAERAVILNNRGVAHKNIGRFDRAIADFSAAITLRHGSPTKALHNRGITRFIMGRFRGAAADLAAFIEQNPDISSPYPLLWLYLARERAGLEGRPVLIRHAKRLTGLSWPGPVVAFHLGKRDPEGLLAAIGQAGADKKTEDACDAYFHLGQYYLLAGKETQARHWFQRTLATGMTHLNEHIAARMELKRLTRSDEPIEKPVSSREAAKPETTGLKTGATDSLKPAGRNWSKQEEKTLEKMLIQAIPEPVPPNPETTGAPPVTDEPVSEPALQPVEPQMDAGKGEETAETAMPVATLELIDPLAEREEIPLHPDRQPGVDTSPNEVLQPPPALSIATARKKPVAKRSLYEVVVGSYQSDESVSKAEHRLKTLGYAVIKRQAFVNGRRYVRVRAGPFRSRETAQRVRDRIERIGGLKTGRIIHSPISRIQ